MLWFPKFLASIGINKDMTSQIIHKELSYEVRGVLLDVYNQMGPMLPEKFYQQAVAIGLEKKGIRCETEKGFSVMYQGVLVGQYYVDCWVEEGKMLLELKVAPEITPLHRAQALSYLKVTQADLAIIANYGASSLMDERLPNYLQGKKPTFTLPRSTMLDVPYPELHHQIIQALYRVHFDLGPGFLHQVYRRATMVDLRQHSIPFAYLQEMPVYFQGVHLGNHASRLILVAQKILLATIAVQGIDGALKTNLRAKLRRLRLPIALLANFGREELELALVRP
ncbi:MAG: GxxExxY protein [Chloroflexi bacterium]|nr:GxxExxY protein [Chloroflexota bacterium]MBP8056793.1 GxxExxY protein [Chloroflexota bacterium]